MTRRRPSSRSARPSSRRGGWKRARTKAVAGRRRVIVIPPALRPPITVVLFDLDDTLYDCFGQRVMSAHRNASRALAKAGLPATADQIMRLRLAALAADPRLEFVDAEVGRKLGVLMSQELRETAQDAYFSTPVRRLRLFPGAQRLLRYLKRRGVRNFIVSFGDPDTQRAKVAALGLDRESAVENIFYADREQALAKEQVFRSILRSVEPDPARILVVGDRPASEIRAGNELGMHTVRMRHGEFARLEPEGSAERADYEIKKITALRRLPFRFGLPR